MALKTGTVISANTGEPVSVTCLSPQMNGWQNSSSWVLLVTCMLKKLNLTTIAFAVTYFRSGDNFCSKNTKKLNESSSQLGRTIIDLETSYQLRHLLHVLTEITLSCLIKTYPFYVPAAEENNYMVGSRCRKGSVPVLRGKALYWLQSTDSCTIYVSRSCSHTSPLGAFVREAVWLWKVKPVVFQLQMTHHRGAGSVAVGEAWHRNTVGSGKEGKWISAPSDTASFFCHFVMRATEWARSRALFEMWWHMVRGWLGFFFERND